MKAERIPTLTIVIVNWNAGQLLRDCISSIANTERKGFVLSEVVVVDNASTDNSLHGIELTSVPVRVVRNLDNRGFAAACNQGVNDDAGDYLLFLNPDTRLFADSLARPISFLEQAAQSSIGICGIRLVDEHGNCTTSAARFPTLRVMTGRILRLSKILPRLFPAHLLTAADLQQTGPVDQVIGAFFLIRKVTYFRCRGFDERFFLYFEEVDLSLRAKQAGYSSYFFSDASACHRGGGSSDQIKATRLFFSLRSRILYARKHYPATAFFVLVFLTMLELPLRLAQSTLRLSWSDMVNSIRAYRYLAADFFGRTRGSD